MRGGCSALGKAVGQGGGLGGSGLVAGEVNGGKGDGMDLDVLE